MEELVYDINLYFLLIEYKINDTTALQNATKQYPDTQDQSKLESDPAVPKIKMLFTMN